VIDYSLVLTDLFPDRSFSVGDTYNSIRPLDGGTVPAKSQLDAAWPLVQYQRSYEEVRAARHTAYAAPDGPDAIFLQWQRGDATEQDWLDSVQLVKQTHPYPPAP
jgi:hypothetical protein